MALAHKEERSRLGGSERSCLHTQAKAETLAQKIRSFWKAKGIDIDVWVEELGGEYVVRSSPFMEVRR
jgi:hypothetical protein